MGPAQHRHGSHRRDVTIYPYQRRVLEEFRKAGPSGTNHAAIAASLGTTRRVVSQAIYELRQHGYRIVERRVLVLVKENDCEEDQGQ